MVPHPRTLPRLGAIRPLNSLRPVRVSVDASGRPRKVILRRPLRVTRIDDQWPIDDEWWRERGISRAYYLCLLEDGSKLTLVQDLLTSRWYTQKG
jgi:hypothetical protein